jgi:hypothetical protein
LSEAKAKAANLNEMLDGKRKELKKAIDKVDFLN